MASTRWGVGCAAAGARRDIQIIFKISIPRSIPANEIIEEGLVIHNMLKPAQRRDRVGRFQSESFEQLAPQFSGGQRQRIAIASWICNAA
jgi:ABC-type microcin C transport system duplicated ATPase subunit YejF